MALLQVRDLDDEVRRELKARAAREGVSLNSLVRDLLSEAMARPSRAEVLARIAGRSERSDVSSADLIRTERDARSRRA